MNRITEILLEEFSYISCGSCDNMLNLTARPECLDCSISRGDDVEWRLRLKDAEMISSRIINAITQKLIEEVN